MAIILLKKVSFPLYLFPLCQFGKPAALERALIRCIRKSFKFSKKYYYARKRNNFDTHRKHFSHH